MTVLKGSDDQMVPDSSSITRNQTSGCTLTDQEKNAVNLVDGSLLSVTTASGIPDFDKLLASLTSPTLVPTTSTTASFVLPTPAGVTSDAPTEDEASRSGTESDYILPPSPTVLPSIHDYLEDMETMYTEPRSFYDDYGIKKEPIDFVHDPVAQTELTPLKPAVGLAAVGFTSQGFTAPSQYTNPYLPPGDDMAYPSYNYYSNSTVSHNMASVSSAMPSGDNCSYGDCLPLSSGAVPAPYMDVEGVACENDLEKIQEKVDYASVTLGIPKDPRQWTAEQSHRWAEWTLSQYNLPSSNVTDFYVAGSLMNSLSQSDFQRKCPYYGEFLYAELDLWKNSFLVGTATSSGSSSNISSSEDEDSCRDLEQLNPTQTYPASSQQDPSRMYPTSLAGIPTPVITPVNPAMTSSTNSVLPMTHSSWSDPMLIQTPLSYTRHMSNGCSNMARMMSPSSISPVPSSSSSSAHLTWRDESHDEMNGLIGNSGEPPVGRGKHAIHLWQFLKELLLQPHQYHNCIRWLDRNKGIFKIEDSSRVALLWGRRKNRPAMNYDKLSRSIRQYYKKGIIKKTEHSKRLVYQFQPQYR